MSSTEAPTTEVVDWGSHPLKDRTDSFGTSEALDEFVANVPSFEGGEDEYVSLTCNWAVWSLERSHLRDESSIKLELAIQLEFGSHLLGDTCRFDDLVYQLMLSATPSLRS